MFSERMYLKIYVIEALIKSKAKKETNKRKTVKDNQIGNKIELNACVMENIN